MPRTTVSTIVVFDAAGGEVIEEEERRGALHGDVVDAVVDEVGADGVVDAELEGDLELGADAVGGGDEDGVGVFVEVEREEAAEAADFRKDLLVEGLTGEHLDALLGAVAGGDVDAGVGVGGTPGGRMAVVLVRQAWRSLGWRNPKSSRRFLRSRAVPNGHFSLFRAASAKGYYTKEMRVMEGSRALQVRAAGLLPGGVDSPVRAFRAVGGDPPFVARAEGAYLWDADGNRYVDCFGSWGPMILGHAFPPVVKAIERGGGEVGELWGLAQGRGEPGGAGAAVFSVGGAAAICVFGDRGLHVGDTAGAGVYGAEVCDQV